MQEQEIQRKRLEEMKNRTEVEMFEKKFSNKKKYRHKMTYDDEGISESNWLRITGLVVSILLGVFAAVFYVHSQ